jgi:pimeloyl-ACP methyl ester carboxylesterase
MYTFLPMVALIIAAGLLLPVMVRHAYRAPRSKDPTTPADLGLAGREIGLETENGKRIFGWYIPPPQAKEKAPAIAILHGWGGSSGQMLPFAPRLHDAGFALLFIDARNHGRSDSDSFSSMPRFAEDLGHGVDWLAEQAEVDPRKLFVLGHSVGAAAALLLASRRKALAGVVAIAAFAHPEELMRRQMASRHLPYIPLGWLVLRYIEKTIGHRFDEIAPCNTIREIHCPVLLVHGEADRFVPMEDAKRIHANRPDERVELLLLPGVGHNSARAIATHGGQLVEFLRRAEKRLAPKPGA